MDLVDAVVFDAEAPLENRQESLLFIMDHTIGFEESDEVDGEAEEKELKMVSNKGKKGGSAIADMISLQKRKHTALQLETLTDFAEHHLGATNLEAVSLLAEACLATHKAGK
jgi:hypothetical protein